MAEKYKDVEIGGREFRIYPPSARDGSWIVGVACAARIYDPDIYARAQGIMWDACRSLLEVNGSKIEQLLYNKTEGRWLIPELNGDIATADALYDDAVDFCLGPTLERRLKKVLAAQQPTEQ
jgi:hypothetical protein